jgi:hypothetical protein
MIVPRFWAEARVRDRVAGRQVTIRRWGWSDESQAAAQTHAEQRARDALERKRAGEDVHRREQKVAYNGADGFPIREEIVERHGETVVTRNGYGALCLNTPNVLFLDIDFPELGGKYLWLLLLAFPVPVAVWYFAGTKIGAFMAFVFALWFVVWLVEWLVRRDLRNRDPYAEHERAALARVTKFVNARPDWEVRVYRTPVGLRVLVTHRTFDPNEPEVLACFRALRVDKLYARMCRMQKCFRARVSPKPWRTGVHSLRRVRPRPGLWPLTGAKLAARAEWVTEYNTACAGFASCRYLDTLGRGGVCPAARPVLELHDRLCKANSNLPLA